MYNIRGRTQTSSPLDLATYDFEETLHEVSDQFSSADEATDVQNAQTMDLTLAEEPSSTDTMVASDEGFHYSTGSDTIMPPLAYRTPIRNRDQPPSMGLVTQGLPRYTRRNASVTVLPDRPGNSFFHDSQSSTQRIGQLSRPTTYLLSRSPSIPLPSVFALPPLDDGSPTSFRSSVTERRRFSALASHRPRRYENMENEPIALDSDRTLVPAQGSGSLTRSRPMQLEQQVGRWQRWVVEIRGWIMAKLRHGRSMSVHVDSHAPSRVRDVTSTNPSTPARLASRQPIPRNSTLSRTHLDFAPLAQARSHPIRTELPRLESVNQDLQNTVIGPRNSMDPPGAINDNHFTSSYRHVLGRTTSFGSSVLTAPGTDERDRDVVMESSSPLAYSNAGSDLVQDMDECQLEGAALRDQAKQSESARAFGEDGVGQ